MQWLGKPIIQLALKLLEADNVGLNYVSWPRHLVVWPLMFIGFLLFSAWSHAWDLLIDLPYISFPNTFRKRSGK